MNYQTVTAYKTPVNLTILFVQIINEFFPMMEEKNIMAVQEIEPELVLSADADKLARVFDNLFRNAVNYSHAGTEIVCSARRGNGCILVNIKNTGDHIPQEKLEHIFDKFYRMDSSRQSSTGGAGLGLAIAKQIVELHDGTIEAVCNDGITEFRIVLPV
jgi:two-component system sensor histidine kinase VanS